MAPPAALHRARRRPPGDRPRRERHHQARRREDGLAGARLPPLQGFCASPFLSPSRLRPRRSVLTPRAAPQSPPRTARSSSTSRTKSSRARKRSRTEHEVAKAHRYRSEDKPRAHADGGGDSSDENGLLPRKGGARDDDSDDSFDASNLPERVPTDDTSGYVESRAELIEDAKAQRRTEQCVLRPLSSCSCSLVRQLTPSPSLLYSFYTPLVIVYWCARLIFSLRALASLGPSR